MSPMNKLKTWWMMLSNSFQERHFDGVYPTFLKYQITDDDINRGRSQPTSGVGISTITVDHNVGLTTQFNFYEGGNYLQIPPSVIGVNKIFHFDGTNTITNNMFSVKYQLFLNDIYYWGSTELLTYAMVKHTWKILSSYLQLKSKLDLIRDKTDYIWILIGVQ
jgi:hypothetical protein